MNRTTTTVITIVGMLGLSLAACHKSPGQVPPASTGPKVNLTWNAPTANASWAGCTTASPCSYVIYRNSNSASDPLTSTNWSKVGTVVSVTAFTDSTPPTGNTAYTVETLQGSQNSGPSNIVSVTVPAASIPLAPQLGTPGVTLSALPPQDGCPTCLVNSLVAKLEPR